MTDQEKAGTGAGARLLRDRLRGRSTGSEKATGLTRVDRSGHLALSFGQRRLWVLDQLRPGGTDQLVPIALRLRGDLSGLDLSRAVSELVRRHEILRTRYTTDEEGGPVAVIDPPSVVKLPMEDLTDAGPRAWDEFLQEEMSQPFDLETSPVLRARLIRLDPGEHVLLIVVHHIAMDGWSSALVVRELADLCQGRDPAEPTAQYADYAAWQRAHAEDDDARRGLAYWTERLRGLPTLDLLTDSPRPAVWRSEGETLSFVIPADLARSLTELAREHRVTPYMVYLAGFLALMGRHTGQTDFAVGTPIAGRTHSGVQDLVGLFINLLVIRADLTGDPSFTDFLGRVRSAALEAYDHQDTPFERVVDALGTGRDLSTHPLITANFTFQNNDPLCFEAGEVVGEPVPVASNQAKFDLSWTLTEHPDGSVEGEATFPHALFHPSSISVLIGHYTRLLRSVAAAPDGALSSLALMDEMEAAELTRAPLRTAPSAPCLHEGFAERARRDPDAVAVTFEGSHLTYRELDLRANRLAHRLRALGARREELVGVCLPRGLDMVTAVLAVLKAGAAYLPLDPEHPAQRFGYLLTDAGARTVITQEDLTDRLSESDAELDHVVVLDDAEEAERIAGLPGTAPETGAHPDDLAYTIYTSGSTGRPKGVQVCHSNVVRLLTSMGDEYGFHSDDVWSMFHSFAFDVSVWELWGAFLFGGRLVVVSSEVVRSPWDLAELVADEGVTVFSQTPSAFRSMVDLAQRGEISPERFRPRYVAFGGEALELAHLEPWWERFGDTSPQLINLYGITETTVHTTHRPVGTADLDGDRSPIGPPIADLALYVLDEHLRPAPVDVPGEIHVAGPGVARGYLGRPALTAERFVPDPYGPPGSRMYRSGDKARVRADGETGFLGRFDDQVKIRGFRIEPGEVESRLTEHPDVRTASVAVDRAEDGRTRLAAYVVPHQGRAVSAPGLRSYLSERLPAYMVPAFFTTLPELPLTVNGKLDRRALPAPDRAGQSAEEFVAARTSAEVVMTREWAAALDVDQIGLDDNFFALGGDSILAVRLVGRMRRAGFEYSVQDLFRNQTVAELLGANAAGSDRERVGTPRFALVPSEDESGFPDTVVDAYPLSQTQAGMVYELLALPGRNNYHNVTSYLVRDPEGFDAEALETAANAVVAGQEILRTSFDLSRPEPLQLVHSEARPRVGHADLRNLDELSAQRALEEFRDRERANVFDLGAAPLVRFHSHRVSDRLWYLSMTECHAVLDGWSHNSLISELLATYRSVRVGRTPAAADVSEARFADFVAEERRSLDDPDALRFWADRLAGPERLTIPGAWADPDGPEDYVVRVPFGDLEAGLRALAAKAGASLKSVLLAAHVAVWRTVAEGPFHSGLVCNGRSEVEGGDRVYGMFLNTVPFVSPSGGGRWHQLVKEVFAEEVELWPHRRFPMPELQHRYADGGRLMDVAFNYLDFHVLDRFLVDTGGSTDVSLNEFPLCATPQSGDLLLVGKSKWVGRDRAEGLALMYRRALELMTEDPDGDAGADLLSVEERDFVLSGVTDARVPLPEEGLHECVTARGESSPEAVAVEAAGESMTYRELAKRADGFAVRLAELGVGRGDRVGLCVPRTTDLVAAVLGTLAVGAVYVPLDGDHPGERIASLLEGSGARAVIADAVTLSRLPEGTPAAVDTATVGSGTERTVGGGAHTPLPGEPAYVVHTSGTTGRPKGVVVSHGALADRVRTMRADMGLSGGDVLLSVVPHVTDVWQLDVFCALMSGARLVLADSDAARDPVTTGALLASSGATVMQASPTTWRMLNEVGWEPPEGFDAVSGGEVLDPGLARSLGRAGARVWDMYGPSEVTVFCFGTRYSADDGAGEWVLAPNTTAYILDSGLRPVPWGCPGQVFVGGPGLAEGYEGQPGATAEAFLPDPFAAPGGRMYATGDRGVRDRDRRVRLLGRIDSQVKIQGLRVEPGEVESVLSNHPGVRNAVVEPFTDPTEQRRLAAYVLCRDETSLDELRQYLGERLPPHMVPASFTAVRSFPRLPNGKVDRRSLPAPTATRQGRERPYEPPRPGAESAIADTWAALLKTDRVGRGDDFFELGGHSLLVLRVIARLEREYGFKLTPRDMLEHRTVSALARVADADTDTRERPSTLLWLGEKGQSTPLFCVHPGGGSVHWYRSLADELAGRRPIGAFEWPGLHGFAEGSTDLDQVAQTYLEDLRAVRPEGPYHILGWCGSSGIAWEMARRLRAEGEDCRLVLIDPIEYPLARVNPLEGHARRLRQAEHLLRILLGEAEADAGDGDDPRAALLELLGDVVDDGERPVDLDGLELDRSWAHRLRSWREIVEARLRYRFPEYGGSVDIVVCDELAEGEYADIVGGPFQDYLDHWRRLTHGGIRYRRVPGNHQSALTPPHVTTLARTLAEILDEEQEE